MQKEPRRNDPSWLRYAGLTTELLVTIGLGVGVGLWIDRKTHLSLPVFTIVLSLGSLVVALWRVIKSTRDG
ncbi:AtpZ/AtpI family protein [Thermoflavifilum thermophilum]|uniref:Putative F0F1-ATPase subunit Ca2+/Mg2+ transporter n=1 Tax=Thermoflavifilum thermophilum TaxID=1393122 RepID=A0A1I7NF06_9BACT|nr:AtpZ/AtpI family protein [Thermoflavifilum thermophilum]SFV33245.1 Putative F0F1-ATPase subunit Ca2+/Mg2+ transporter [Thermoflavifilum thermophilum]